MKDIYISETKVRQWDLYFELASSFFQKLKSTQNRKKKKPKGNFWGILIFNMKMFADWLSEPLPGPITGLVNIAI